ncbi:mechanosensitive channel of small conductance-like 10 [Hibiscus trionum]|uniref:Mechanosensitive channel of small conductance-like 10 n=1 Tax=Hibiscus trionum TaxID=183268 RepID=A0A9W7J996_HIBTR|nr:mechanosensitive channel of small conductance-like 10 [Hibiscus trionum]
MAEKRSSGGEVVIDVHSGEDPPNEIEALDPEQNAQVPSPTAGKLPRVRIEKYKPPNKRMVKLVVLEWVIFLLLLGCLIASLTVDKLHNTRVWDLKSWKWCLLVLVIFSGMSIARCLVSLVVFLIEINFLLRKKVRYVVHGLKKTVQVFIWLSSVVVTWLLLFLDVERSKTAKKILDNVTWVLVSILIGAFLWLLKTLSFMMLASTFHKNKFFDRIQESVFHQYVLRTLSGPPLMESKMLIHTGKVHKLKREKVSSWHMKVLVDAITNSGLSTIFYDEHGELTDKEISNEEEAIYAAHQIFCNVARHDSWDNRYIEEDDLLRFMVKEEVDLVFPLFEESHSGKISRKSFTNWVVKVYMDRKVLAHGLIDTKIVVEQLNKLVIAILIVVTFIIWLLLVGTATTRVLLVIAAFLFGESCKTIFQVVIFIFVMHPFDVGDRCVVDGVQLLVEEINIFTTAFLKSNNEKVYYPNSVLFSKPISNYYRSPDMGEAIEFCIDSN